MNFLDIIFGKMSKEMFETRLTKCLYHKSFILNESKAAICQTRTEKNHQNQCQCDIFADIVTVTETVSDTDTVELSGRYHTTCSATSFCSL